MAEVTHHILLNAGAGTVLATGVDPADLVKRFASLGYAVSIDADASRPFSGRLRSAGANLAPVLVAAGGDGTATALAQVAVATGRTLAILPLGTANLLARDLGLPLTIDEWFAAYPSMKPHRIDVGEMNGRVFLHKVVIGAVPKIAAMREQIRGRGGDLPSQLAFLAHFFRLLSRLRRFAVEVTPNHGDPHIERVQSIAVANNDYEEGPGKIFARTRLDAGTLSLYLIRQLGAVDAIRLAMRMLIGSWKSDDVLEIENVRSVVIRTRWRQVRAMIDGEVELVQMPLSFRSMPLALSVLVPNRHATND